MVSTKASAWNSQTIDMSYNYPTLTLEFTALSSRTSHAQINEDQVSTCLISTNALEITCRRLVSVQQLGPE